jgi:hypothetical protein
VDYAHCHWNLFLGLRVNGVVVMEQFLIKLSLSLKSDFLATATSGGSSSLFSAAEGGGGGP